MEISKRNVWQVSGGPANRAYGEVFLRHGVALVEQGDAGAWRPERDRYFDGGVVRRFAEEVNIGDIFLLRTGRASIQAVGVVASDYLYLPQFDDVNGWDLQHARRVRWYRLPEEYTFEGRGFGGNPPRFSMVTEVELIDYAKRFIQSPPTDWQFAKLPELPVEEPELEKIPDHLQEIVSRVHDLADLYWDSERFGDFPCEDEMLAHYVVPFLQALGWQPEQIAIKWRFVDVTVFKKLPRIPENIQFIIEAKRLGQGVEGALEQGRGYLESLGVQRDVLVSDGIRYRLYGAENDFAHLAYANLARMKPTALELFDWIKRP